MKSYHTFIAGMLSSSNKDHIGISQAILVGDLIFSWVYEIMYKEYESISKKHIIAGQKNMQETIEEVIAGQIIDVDMMVGDQVSVELLEKKNHYKSGKYTFVRPLLTGALLAGADTTVCKKLEKIGEVL